jgi:hypothetical protein
MIRSASSSSSSSARPIRNDQASGSGTKPVDSLTAKGASKPGAQSSGPTLKRSNSLPAHLPSHPREATEVKADRKPITRPEPDLRYTRESFNFRLEAGGSRRGGAKLKQEFMEGVEKLYSPVRWMKEEISWNRDHMDLIHSVHPKFHCYSRKKQLKAFIDLANTHPQVLAELAKWRNREYGVPNYPTSSRLMKPDEQKFLSQAMQLIQENVARNPFHIHGESGVVGDKHGENLRFTHNPKDEVTLPVQKGDQYAMHSHPPFQDPLASSASEADHRVAAASYLEFNRLKEYVTNGKDVMHIPSDNLQLIHLHPDPKMEETLGKFPVAFTVPTPRQPAYPFHNHEAPAAFKKDWQPPAGWTPPEDYPRGV